MKYQGSKSRITKYIIPILQKCIDDNNLTYYCEPFVGGCNVIDKIHCQHLMGSDKNKYLIALFKHLQQGGKLLDSVSRELYSSVRANYTNGTMEDWYIANIGFLASYNGRWFDGGYAKSGYEKTSKGQRYRDYYQESKANILAQIPNIKNVELFCKDYSEWNFDNIYDKVLIYCDPPYANTKSYEFAKDFSHFDFWNTVRKWSEKSFVLVSEESAPNDFICVWQKEVSRSIKATEKSISVEKLFTYKDGKYAVTYADTLKSVSELHINKFGQQYKLL